MAHDDITDQLTQPPAWLNLDAVASPAIRDRLNQAAEAVEALLPALEAACKEAHAATVEYEEGVSALKTPDDFILLVDPMTGAGRLCELLEWVEVLAGCAHRDPMREKPWPTWYGGRNGTPRSPSAS